MESLQHVNIAIFWLHLLAINVRGVPTRRGSGDPQKPVSSVNRNVLLKDQITQQRLTES